MATAYSEPLKDKIFELRAKGVSADVIAERINNMKRFEDEIELTATSVHGIVHRYGKNGNGAKQKKNGKGAAQKTVPCHIKEYMTTINEDVVVLTFSLPRAKLVQVEHQLGIHPKK